MCFAPKSATINMPAPQAGPMPTIRDANLAGLERRRRRAATTDVQATEKLGDLTEATTYQSKLGA
jgi:hypothetical protein